MTENKEKKKISLWRKLTTEDWMTSRQLKVYVAIILAFEAVMIYLVFIVTTQIVGSTVISGVLSIVLYLVVAYGIIRYRTRTHWQPRTSTR